MAKKTLLQIKTSKKMEAKLIEQNKLMFSIPQSAKILDWNSRRLWDKVHEHRDAILNASCLNVECIGQCKNGIPTVRIGARYFITKEALLRFIKNLQRASFEDVLHGK